jgi:hypothetical protein
VNSGAGDNEHLPRLYPPQAGADGSPEFRRLAAELFRTREGEAFVDIETRHRRETVPVQSKQFRQFLSSKLREETGKRPSQSALTSWINELDAYASQDAPVADVHVRIASVGDRIYLDLADDRGRAVEISPYGWEVVDTVPVHFARPPGMKPLPSPAKGGSLAQLRPLINVADEDFILIVGCLLDGLRGGRSHPVLVFTGAEGTAKTAQLAIFTELIDPQPIGGLPATESRLGKIIKRHVLAFDNVSDMSRPVADALCRLSTMHPVIINGIEDFVKRPDLADRSVFVKSNSIPDERRQTEEEIRAEFERKQAQILGVLLDAVSHGLRSLPTTRPVRLPRLADFARWVIACEGALWPPGTFMPAYFENRAEAAEKLIETDVVAAAVQALMAKRSPWSGTATELDMALRVATHNLEGAKGWPASPRILADRLRALTSSLGKTGINVAFAKVGHDHKRVITLCRRPNHSDPPTTASPPAASADGNLDPGNSAADDGHPEPESETQHADASADDADDADDGRGTAFSADAAGPADGYRRPASRTPRTPRTLE